ncbi:hypothetical protein [Halomonas halmophila]|uniref:Uncharacterized protein n=1 Tax=Halomonas halmophila TaxID=252 RepID=A0A4Y4EUL4_9GAMM|nr:hypothetical protein [Halomonas halmophila]GED21602.1 hypothetical protein HHA01_05790 [Halomonas halmophila]
MTVLSLVSSRQGQGWLLVAVTLIILLEKLISPWQWLANLLGLGLMALGVLILVG